MTRLSSEEKRRIHDAVVAAEARCAAHIAVAIVPASDRYALYPLVWGALAALAGGGVLAVFAPHLTLREGFALEAALFLAASLLADWWPLRILLVPRHVRRGHARALAHREFAARILSSNERKSGLLIFVSSGERYVEILADREVHAKVGAEAWERIVAALLACAREGNLANGIVAAIDACAAHL
jgi:putative membrane protein